MTNDPRDLPLLADAGVSISGADAYGRWMAFTFRRVRHIFRWIEPGWFLMGSPGHEPERFADETQHQVTISQGFWLGEAAVTQALWVAVMGSNPSYFKGEERPVERVSWTDAQDFLEALNGEWGDLAVRLPTEAEWEYACRAGTSTPFSLGETISIDEVNYRVNIPYSSRYQRLNTNRTLEVKDLGCNPWGLYQMHGNVREWCQDRYGKYPSGAVTDPKGTQSGIDRVLRGGSWANSARYCRSADRLRSPPEYRPHSFGIRLARS